MWQVWVTLFYSVCLGQDSCFKALKAAVNHREGMQPWPRIVTWSRWRGRLWVHCVCNSWLDKGGHIRNERSLPWHSPVNRPKKVSFWIHSCNMSASKWPDDSGIMKNRPHGQVSCLLIRSAAAQGERTILGFKTFI